MQSPWIGCMVGYIHELLLRCFIKKYFENLHFTIFFSIYSSITALENGSSGSGMNNPFAMMGGMPGLAGLMGMGGGGPGLNSGQLSSMWGGMAGPRSMAMPGMGGFNRGMMEQVRSTGVFSTDFIN